MNSSVMCGFLSSATLTRHIYRLADPPLRNCIDWSNQMTNISIFPKQLTWKWISLLGTASNFFKIIYTFYAFKPKKGPLAALILLHEQSPLRSGLTELKVVFAPAVFCFAQNNLWVVIHIGLCSRIYPFLETWVTVEATVHILTHWHTNFFLEAFRHR